jgi:Holliday junction resolvase RusA-like endonuclease
MTTYRLPFPPPLSALTNNVRGNGRAASPRYEAWTDEAGWMLKQQKAKPFGKRCWLLIGLETPNNRRTDASNRIKAVEDILVKMGVLEDDSRDFIRGTFAYWLDRPGKECRVTLQDAEKAHWLCLPKQSEQPDSEAA